MEKPLHILIADDDAGIIAPFLKGRLLDNADVTVKTAEAPDEILRAVSVWKFDIVFLDIDFGAGVTSGLELISRIRQHNRKSKIVMLSSQDQESCLFTALSCGADDFLSKRNDKIKQLPQYILSYIAERQTDRDDELECDRLARDVGAAVLSPKMREVFKKVVMARRNPLMPVLITGETGTGKEVVAAAVSLGRGRPRVAIDCGAISENLAESELFGHVKGSFTGADRHKIGKFAQASGGDLFLDEIGNLKRGIQEKLLRAIQLREITPVGSLQSEKVDARIVAATNENLQEMVADGRFRADLLERLKGVWIEIPPLRERLDELEALSNTILMKHGRTDLRLSTTCLTLFRSYPWPGNVRELESVLVEMMAASSSAILTIAHIPKRLTQIILMRHDGFKSAGGDLVRTSINQFVPPQGGSWDVVVDELMKFYIPQRYMQLGRKASQRELATSLGLARNTLASHLKRLNIQLCDDVDSVSSAAQINY
jgi:DNA-binding NtrC family response regulator